MRVGCNENSGHVVKLDLSWLGGAINSSLLEPQHLTSLDLTMFNGTFNPYQFGNLSRLVSLKLGGYHFVSIESLMWLSHLPALEELDISDTNLSQATDWLQAINSLPSLINLDLSRSELSQVRIPYPISHANSSTSLAVAHLSGNSITSSIFPWLFNFNNSLVDVILAHNVLQGRIPDAFGAMISLECLDLSWNFLEGNIPRELVNLHRLRILDLSTNNLTGDVPNVKNSSSLESLCLHNNMLNGSLTESVGLLSNLQNLDISSNFMKGVISDAHFLKLNKLVRLKISSNSFQLNFSSNWVPPFHLKMLDTSHCTMGPGFPQWLRTQKDISYLDISHAGISDAVPSWFWELPFTLAYLNLSNNQINGEVHNLPSIVDDLSSIVDLSHNHFHGSIPLLPSNVSKLSLSNNMFSGNTSNLCSITGGKLMCLDLSDNFLSEELPDCWTYFESLVVLSLANNNFSGSTPISFGSLLSVQTLNLRNNSFSGELPLSTGNFKDLKILDFGENQFSGKIPNWIGTNLTDLIVLRLRSNRFYGTIPLNLSHLVSIHIFDFSDNNITGSIPQCFSNLTTMFEKGSAIETISHKKWDHNNRSYTDTGFIDHVILAWKGRELEFGKTLGLVKSIDLSCNNLNGEIPVTITGLLGVVSLNLSHNQLIGVIPSEIGQMKSLESLDLSANQLSGRLPEGLCDLNFLNYLNLSQNNFSGKIPSSTQLQSFDKASFMGNAELCGKPLPNDCPGEQAHSPSIYPRSKIIDKEISPGFYVSMGLGFATGFWGVCGSLLLNRSWRRAYFDFVSNMLSWLQVTTVLTIAQLRRRLLSK